MKLSRNFSLPELTHSQTALRHGIGNRPSPAETERLYYLARTLLEPVRDFVGRPFSPTSGFRSLALNRLIGSADTSQHVRGEAVDLKIPGLYPPELAGWIRRNLTFDQLILEFHSPDDPASGWVHCSVVDPVRRRDNRNQALVFDGVKYREMDDVYSG
ncbi:D-Ala-D-Ala carboxypeptidase family metallohydrolase [Emcibacter sp.]|uniref:D-Ala-D-Ala carboxypeptidase family metallohydrolase n=1 Tax=Emcibacter sp. TaxID=1979954 RepID=UPI002AA7DB36|nr:D-Ala-D-Ala carboxypeptidase family metallohydrolase [Emcibacter sp.]